jgi:hypothetical protein
MVGPPTNKIFNSGELRNTKEHDKLIEKLNEIKIEIKLQWIEMERSTSAPT